METIEKGNTSAKRTAGNILTRNLHESELQGTHFLFHRHIIVKTWG